jgi:putative ABC transport system permease protein
MGDGELLSTSSTKGIEVKARDLTDLALRNLREALFRKVLTTLGVAVGVAPFVAMLSLSVGLQELASKTPVTAILEGRREIGVLKTVGAADSDVQQLFFVEAALWVSWAEYSARSLAGSWASTHLRDERLSSSPKSQFDRTLFRSVVAAAVCTLLCRVVSLAAGLYPASRGAKLNPVDALRYE